MRRSPPRVRFPPDDGFHATVKRLAGAHLEATGRARWGAGAMHAKTATIVGWFGASYAALLLWGGSSAWLAAALTLSLALAMAGIGFSVMHDANHGAYSRSARVNRWWGLALDLVGASSYVWRFRHNVLHHTYPNVDGMDVAIDAGPLLRFAPTQRRRGFHRWQHVYAWPLYGLIAMKWWFVDDVVDVARGRIGPFTLRRPRGRELVAFVAGKGIFVAWAIVIPALVHRSGWVALPFLAGAWTLGIVLSAVFQLAHVVPDVEFQAASPGGQPMPTGWAEHQVRATLDFAPSNRLLGWYVGGLNFQIEHHLLPDVCHVHYPALAPIVAATCLAYGVPYRTLPTLRSAIAHHQRFLRALGRREPPRRAGITAGAPASRARGWRGRSELPPAGAAPGRGAYADVAAERARAQLGRRPQLEEVDELRPRGDQRGRVSVGSGEEARHLPIQVLDDRPEPVGARHDLPPLPSGRR